MQEFSGVEGAMKAKRFDQLFLGFLGQSSSLAREISIFELFHSIFANEDSGSNKCLRCYNSSPSVY